ncbi:hypothetical protein DB347_24195 [Opitutaceae bacterium EW11]|nr:hypothetical protein DB347_24195 [Opitutaceae bacterium EW11]
MKSRLLSCLAIALILSSAGWAQTPATVTHSKKAKHHHSSTHHRSHKHKGSHHKATTQPTSLNSDVVQPLEQTPSLTHI